VCAATTSLLVRLLRRSAVDWGLRCLGAPYDTHTRSGRMCIEQVYKVVISYCVTNCVLHHTHIQSAMESSSTQRKGAAANAAAAAG
jgi:hypothetical protein